MIDCLIRPVSNLCSAKPHGCKMADDGFQDLVLYMYSDDDSLGWSKDCVPDSTDTLGCIVNIRSINEDEFPSMCVVG